MRHNLPALVAETITKVIADSPGSKEVVLAWLEQPGYQIDINYKTGKPDTKAFCNKIYSNFGELLVPQEQNPAKFYGFASVDVLGPSIITFPEQLKAARGMKAVFKWLNENIDSVIHNSENDIRINKKVTKVLSEMSHLSKSNLLTTDERSTISKMYDTLLNRLSLPLPK